MRGSTWKKSVLSFSKFRWLCSVLIRRFGMFVHRRISKLSLVVHQRHRRPRKRSRRSRRRSKSTSSLLLFVKLLAARCVCCLCFFICLSLWKRTKTAHCENRALSWGLTEAAPEGPKVVILKRMFDPAKVDNHDFYTDLKLDIGEECAKFGPLQKVKVFNVRVCCC